MKTNFAILALLVITAISSPAQGLIVFGNTASATTKISTNSTPGGSATGLTAASVNGPSFYYALYVSQTATTVNGVATPIAGSGGNYVFNDPNWSLAAYGTNTGVLGRFSSTTGDINGFTTISGVPPGTPVQFVVLGWSSNIGSTILAVQSWFQNGNPASTGFVGESAVSGAIVPSTSGGFPVFLFGPQPPQLQGFTLGIANPQLISTVPGNVPAISSFFPALATGGAVIAISGTNFSPAAASNIVHFGAVRASVLTASPTNLTVVVPPGGTFGPITVTVGGFTAYSLQMFEPTFAGSGTNITTAGFAPGFDLNTSNNPALSIIADLDGDGRPDIALITSSGLAIFQNISTNGVPLSAASFAPPVILPFPTNGTAGNPYRLRAVDLDGDGRLDLIASEVGGNRISVFHNISTPGTLTANSFAAAFALIAGNDCRSAAAADLDADGRVDIVALNYGDKTISIFKNIGLAGTLNTNSFAPPVVLPAPGGPYEVAIADLDGDGRPDLAVASSDSGTVTIYQNLTTPGVINSNSFAPGFDLPCGNTTAAIVAVDLDGDGKIDLVAGSVQSENISVFQNATIGVGSVLTTNSFPTRVDFPTGYWTHSLAVADFNGDGKPDIAVVGELPSTMSIFQNISTPGPFTSASFAPRVDFSTGYNAWGIAAGDLDGDGRPDIVFCNYYDATLEIYQNVMPLATTGTTPMIVSQTPSQIVAAGTPATFSVTASGFAPLSYLWSQNGAAIPGATNSSYTITNALLSDSGSEFSCLVTNAYGSATSTNVFLKVIETVANGLCSGAIIVSSASYTNTQSTLMADSPGNPVPDCVDGFGHGVWYEFTAPQGGLLEVDTFGSDFDTGLAIYTGSCGAMNEVACNDDAAGGLTSQVMLPAVASTNYFILAGGYDSDAGDLVLHLNYYTPPAFVIGPASISVVVSSNAVFSPILSGSLPMSFQWYFNNTPLVDGGGISGSTNSTLIVADVQTNEGGNYQLVVSNFVGMATSSVAVLTPVILPPTILQAPVSQSVGTGSNVTFTAVAGGTPPFSYQWYLNGSVLADYGGHVVGSVTASLSISNLTPADAGLYSLTVTNLSGSATTRASLVVLTPPVFTVQAVGRSVPPGLPTSFSNLVTGIPSPGGQWRLNGTNIPGATGLSYSIPAVGSNNLGLYQLVASNTMGVVTSTPAQLTFGPVAAWGNNTDNECLPPPGLTNVMSVVSAYGGSLAVLADGTLAGWGITNIPAAATNVVAVSSAYYISQYNNFYLLRSDGSVVLWQNEGAPGSVETEPGLTNIVAVAGYGNEALALRADGAVDSFFEIYPGVPAGLNHITAIGLNTINIISSGIALRSDGTVIIWGSGAITNTIPPGLTNVTAIAAGDTYDLALTSNGTVVAWGSGPSTNLPPGLTNIVAISADNYNSSEGPAPNFNLAIRANGTIVAWGGGYYGETNPPAALSNLLTVAVAPGPFHGLALVNNGAPQILLPPIGLTADAGRNITLKATAAGAAPLSYQWLLNGTNLPAATNASLALLNIQPANAGSYQLMVSNVLGTAVSLSAPVQVLNNPSLTFLNQIGMSSLTNVVNQGGTFTFYGGTVLGNGPLNYQWYFAPSNVVTKTTTYSAVPGATNDTLAFNPALATQSGLYYLAVSNSSGGTTSAPVSLRVLFAKAWGYFTTDAPFALTNATAVALDNYGSGTQSVDYFALSAAGKIYSWSSTIQQQVSLTNFTALSNSVVTAIAAGNENVLALKSDGTVFVQGFSEYGITNVPATVNGITAIACGDYHDLALRYDGTVIGWGQNIYGQATGTNATNVVSIAAGGENSIALRSDGSVTVWGEYALSYPPPSNVTNVIAIAAGGQHFLALRNNGTVAGWGNNTYGQTTIPTNWTNIVAISAGGNHSTALRNDGTVLAIGVTGTGTSIFSTNIPSNLANIIAISSSGDRDLSLFGTRAPAITVQPWSRTVYNSTTSVWFSAKCSGVQPVTYQWQFNGTNLPGATNDLLVINSTVSGGVQSPKTSNPLPAGVYQLIANNAYGTTASKYAQLTVVIPLGTAVNATNSNWTTSGDALWFGETNYTHDGVSAVQSGDIGPFEETTLQTTVATNVPGNYTFWWMVSSEPDFDFLTFNLNGVAQTNISGSVGWQFVSIPAPIGTNVLTWTYSQESIYSSGLGAGWVDQFTFVPAPVLTMQPVSRTNYAGTTAQFFVEARNQSSYTYQWQKNGVNLFNGGNVSGATNFALFLSNVQDADAATYTVIVSTNGASTTSTPATLTVLDSPPIFLSQPSGVTNNAGTKATFTANVAGVMPMSYQWQKNGVNLPAAGTVSGTITLMLTNVQDADAANYQVVVTNVDGSITSSPAFLAVVDTAPVISSQPVSVSSLAGGTVSFVVSATGTAPLSYQWLFGGTNLVSATNSSLTLSDVTTTNVGSYQVIVTNSLGQTSSATATLNVLRSMVVAWGDNTYGQTNVPPMPANVVGIAAGPEHSLALLANSTVVAWGYNWIGETNVPAGLTNVVAVAAGDEFSLALQANGTVTAWGNDYYGQTDVPAGLTNVVEIASGEAHSLALLANGTVVAWGENNDGQANVPAGLSNVVMIAAGDYHNLALQANGSIVAWGYNNYGQTDIPAGLNNAIAVAGGDGRSMVLQANGTVVGWGYSNFQGQTNVPAGLTNVVAIAAGGIHDLALQANGMVVAWGYDAYGETNVPADLTNAVAVSGGAYYSLAIQNDGSPTLITQPASQIVSSNTTVQFTVKALGTPPLSYQWQKNGTNMTDGGNAAGSTNATLTVSNIQPSDAATYVVVVTNFINSVTSSPAVLGLISPPAILLQPVSQTVVFGTNVQFRVVATGTPSPSYQWWWNCTNQIGGNSAMLTLAAVGGGQAGTYSVTVANSAGVILSSNVVLNVLVPQLLGTPLLSNGALLLTSSNMDGSAIPPSALPNFVAQASTNLINWVTLPNALSLTNGMLLLQDQPQPGPARFYRIIEQ